MSRAKGTVSALVIVAASLLLAAPSVAQVQPYGTNDYGGQRNILPPGQGRTVNGVELADFLLLGNMPSFYDDQREMYGDLVYATPGLPSSQIDQYFKDGTFGVKPGDVDRTYSPRPGVTVVRDAGFGVPHIYGDTREDMMFGAGYVGAEDRLFFMDALRHAGRGQLSEFAGGANKSQDIETWDVAPYTETDLQRQIDLADEVYGATGVQLREDLTNYVAGVNEYIGEALLDPTKLPGEYAALGTLPETWKGTDVIATASLVGGIFGKGGGGELTNAEVYNAARARFGKVRGIRVWRDLRRANDPEAPTTVIGRRFPYQARKGIKRKAVAIPDRGSLVDGSPDDATAVSAPAPPTAASSQETATSEATQVAEGGLLAGLGSLGGGSNALLVSGRESRSGHPLAVFGPQVSYFAPQILMEQDMHAPDFDARGVAFVGVNLFVLLGRGQDYAWSATSAGQDIIDTFAEKLCEPDGSKPTITSMHYRWRGRCRPIEVLTRVNEIQPNLIDPSPAETFTLEAQRTVHGIVSKRGTVNGVPVAFAKLRSTYFHEADSAIGFSDLNTPSKTENAREFQQAVSKIGFTFNWFYADDRDIAYFNSGNNPVRAKGTDPEFPAWGTGKWDWRGWDPVVPGAGPGIEGGTNTARYTRFDAHPQVINQPYLTSWNNKQAHAYRAAEAQYGYGSIYRSEPLDDRIRTGIRGGRKLNLAGLIDAMEDAGTVDLRGAKVLPWMLRVLKRGKGGAPADLRDEVAALSSWVARGAHRRDRDHNGVYEEARAVELMDAWWPRSLEGIFRPSLGSELYAKLRAALRIDDPPGPIGSAYQDTWGAYVEKDLRRLLGRRVRGAFSRSYCGSGKSRAKRLKTCKARLAASLRAASAVPSSELYPAGDDCDSGDAQVCHDAVRFRTTGGVSVDEIHWINRPTWQQVLEIPGHRGRGDDRFCAIARGGSKGADNLLGTALSDRIFGRAGNDRITGLQGNDCLSGQAGDDTLNGGPGIDKLRGGGGSDLILSRDNKRDTVSCGGGDDTARVDRRDRVRSGCETELRRGATNRKR